MRVLFILLLWLVAMPAAARPMAEIAASGELRVGVNPNFPPMSSYGADNTLGGFDVDVARALAGKLKVRLVLVPTEAAQRVPFLTAGRIDMSMGALTITPERAALIDFTMPLHSEAMGVITTSRTNITRWQELDRADITIVNMRGNQSVELLKEKLPKPQRLLVDGNADTIRAIAQGRADALVENVDFFLGFTRNYPETQWKVLSDPIYVAWCAIGVGKGNDSLRIALDTALAGLHRDGTILRLWSKHYNAPMTVPVSEAQIEDAGKTIVAGGSGAYRFDFSDVLGRVPYLLGGAVISLQIAFLCFWLGAAIGLAGAIGKLYGPAPLAKAINVYVQGFTNTPALVQIFLLYYALPDAGVMLGAFTAVVIGLTLNAGAYLTEILRAGVASVRRAEIEAAQVLGLSRLGILRHVMLPHILQTVYKPLANFFIILILGSSMAALFGVEELTGRAINISTVNLRTIETFSVVALIYIGLTLIASATLAVIGRHWFRIGVKRVAA
ncbi:His/Glu/Gln/Arg/opine family amino acid ABC transporter permease subunit [Polymorphobacter multimanifer]|uniref:His/Glu/Gln/Arg/opine family amino acid ABC transporter permease subunit n=3 Tax=Polymorphobacter multimanifer TaxID=1070431 RepID=A0A841L592_9SPHN|nr:ABC transporter substrate-binding protein/permease [Polymorphobacter multimanifer]MBB6227784.1 His/Glu/Gln/Arg/opine family amino acid ABC transporter permease subunit [Polymorphobacter multimanifer]